MGGFGAEENVMAKPKLSSYLQHRYHEDFDSFTGASKHKYLLECTWHSQYPFQFAEGDVVLVKGTAEKRLLFFQRKKERKETQKDKAKANHDKGSGRNRDFRASYLTQMQMRKA